MKKYKVEGFSELVDVAMNTNTVEEAGDFFDTLMASNVYYEGRITDNRTGELYCYFTKEADASGIKTEYWTAFA